MINFVLLERKSRLAGQSATDTTNFQINSSSNMHLKIHTDINKQLLIQQLTFYYVGLMLKVVHFISHVFE